MTHNVGFIGLGSIGLLMAKRVLASGYEMTVCGNVQREPIEEMVRLGASEVGTLKEVGQKADVVITMVRNDIETEEVLLGPDGVLEAMREGGCIIMMSTLTPPLVRRMHQACEERGVQILESPVTGAPIRAETGELALMVGGKQEVIDAYRPVLETMATTILHCGDVGMGNVLKLTQNVALFTSVSAYYEAIAFGIANGASEELILEQFRISSADCWIARNWDYVRSMHVDPPRSEFHNMTLALDYILGVGREIGQPCPITALVRGLQTAGPLNKLLDDALSRSSSGAVSRQGSAATTGPSPATSDRRR
jgi:3-hydroxyisobutyrate dehydrogenase-like beta-hydroxyacid dehydrogenase